MASSNPDVYVDFIFLFEKYFNVGLVKRKKLIQLLLVWFIRQIEQDWAKYHRHGLMTISIGCRLKNHAVELIQKQMNPV